MSINPSQHYRLSGGDDHEDDGQPRQGHRGEGLLLFPDQDILIELYIKPITFIFFFWAVRKEVSQIANPQTYGRIKFARIVVLLQMYLRVCNLRT
jgi:hypothetical protein